MIEAATDVYPIFEAATDAYPIFEAAYRCIAKVRRSLQNAYTIFIEA
jgi:hypothetical protein